MPVILTSGLAPVVYLRASWRCVFDEFYRRAMTDFQANQKIMVITSLQREAVSGRAQPRFASAHGQPVSKRRTSAFLLYGLYCRELSHRVYPRQMDSISPQKRSWVMAQVKGRDTRPEMAVRSLLHRMGYRFRLHRKDLPGKPDIVLPRFRTAIFVHGCFWHRHAGCKRASMPTSNVAYWQHKFERNVARDAAHKAALEKAGWRVLVVWECELKDLATLQRRLQQFLETLPTAGNNN